MVVLKGLIFVVLIMSMVYFVLRTLRLNAYVKHLPNIPFALLTPLLIPNKRPAEIFQGIEKIVNAYNGMSKFWLGPKLAVLCDDPEDIKTILLSKDCISKPYFYRLIAGTGNGIFTSKGDHWRSDRKAINTVFSLSTLKTFLPIFNRNYDSLAKKLEKYVNGPESDLTDDLFQRNIDIVFETMFRFDYGTMNGDSAKAVRCIGRIWEIAVERASTLILHPTFIYRFSKLHAEEKTICDQIFQISPHILSCTQENRLTELSNEPVFDHEPKKTMILVEKLLEMEEQNLIDRQGVLDQMNTLIVGATDTSSITSLNTLLLLAIHQNVQDRLYEEIRTNVTDYDYIDYDTLTKLEYMDHVLKESMRLLPLAQIMLRESESDIQLTKCIVPKGTVLLLCALKMNQSKQIWGPTVKEFDPDRFLADSMAQRHPYAYVPFGAGARNCIGHKFAMISLKVMLCKLLLKYKFTTSMRMSDIAFKFEFLLKLNNNYMLKVEKRHIEQ